MTQKHAPGHGRRKALVPALWLAAVVVVLFTSLLVAIVLSLHHLAQLAVEIATRAGYL
jgi:hypothetical protein